MIRSGLLSVTFRKHSPREIISLVSEAGLQALEWGGDVHVPHGDLRTAGEIGRMTREAGIEISSYGSYYRVGVHADNLAFGRVLETAVSLKAPSIRVWAGDLGSAEADERWWYQVITDAQHISGMAMKEGIAIDFEYHGGTLTDSQDSANRLLLGIDRPNVRCNWQTPINETMEQRSDGLSAILPSLANIHVFHWLPDGRRCSLDEGRQQWLQYIRIIQKAGKTHYALLEFVKDDSTEQFRKDAQILNEILRACSDESTSNLLDAD
ncbi:sugar phosphate isomerase/epimerase family protein [Paenibacillus eucommiae]|uniref:Sugar phosphate isomerase/epimerase n=1 Tax=Paenibacillus eucommiae TaxID=1355755 RepID=A0ABS4IZK3_9BACL|nr:TIM barrel protein [Paenibacillus eucommiae]MBP1991964.1 sugar phosphate isomerase/epimerase [Paenibacillus eucommiae]